MLFLSIYYFIKPAPTWEQNCFLTFPLMLSARQQLFFEKLHMQVLFHLNIPLFSGHIPCVSTHIHPSSCPSFSLPAGVCLDGEIMGEVYLDDIYSTV